MKAVTPFLEVTDAIKELGGADLEKCMQCATCTGVCPWNLVKYFSPRGMIRLAQFGLEGFESEDLWNCVTCNTCVINCPRGLEIINIIRSMRIMMNETGSIPASLKGPVGSASNRGNPWSGEPEDRTKWAEGLGVKEFSSHMDYLYFTCCTQAYDARNQKAGQSLIKVLQAGGVDFGLLKKNEKCCGDAIRKMGGEELFISLAESNLSVFTDKEVKRIITGSPHCYNTFLKEYPEFGGDFEVRHYTQILKELIEKGDLKPTRRMEKRVTYHDPCYLGRHNNIYEPPREVLKAIPGLELVEMERNRENSLCCGGGGGGLWNEVPAEERFSVLRVEEAAQAGAQVIAAACPYCISMFEDALKTIGKEEEMKVMDISEIVLGAL
ncbi:MAG: (Fe-S)-binding protein [Thermodesulfobacteriota bacterium]|nr:(Fe-S)-binding protein [Thermodesulfobacteriota bacterium]